MGALVKFFGNGDAVVDEPVIAVALAYTPKREAGLYVAPETI
jgi:hypothetical protein